MIKLACIQMTTACDPSVNLTQIETRVRAAVAAGAQFVALPETCVFMERGRKAMQARLEGEAASDDLHRLQTLAQDLQIYLLIGSMVLQAEVLEAEVLKAGVLKADDAPTKAVNRSLLLAPTGEVVARYDKIHMFDVTLESGETHAESASYQAGEAAVLADMAIGDDALKLGLSICYDVRFPSLYRRLAEAGAQLISVPSAFTVPTGEAHWHILLRARAIETGAYIFAPAQVGAHENGRETYGHSLIVDPWGAVIAEAEADDAFIIADIDLTRVARARAQLPALTHGRRFRLPNGDMADD